MMYVPLGDTYYVKFTTRRFSTGAPFTLAGTPAVDVYEEANLTQITGAETLTVDYDGITGLNDLAIVCSTGNGFEVGKYYSAVITAGTVDSVSVVGEVVAHFRVMPAEDAGAGIPDVNVATWLDTAAATPTTAGVPEVDVTFWAGSATATNDVAIATAPTNFADLSITATSGRVDVGSWLGTAVTTSATTNKPEVDVNSVSDDATAANNLELMYDGTGYAGGTEKLQVDAVEINSSTTAAAQLALGAAQIESGAAEGTPTTTVIQTDLAETQDDIYIGRIIIFTSGNARGEATDITDYTGSTGTVTVTALANAPAAADTFIIL